MSSRSQPRQLDHLQLPSPSNHETIINISEETALPPPISSPSRSCSFSADLSYKTSDPKVPVDIESPPSVDPADIPLPEKNPKLRRMFKLPVFSAHRRLIALIALINIALLVVAIVKKWWRNLPALGYLVISNITVAILIRQQRVINLLFWLATCTGTFFPLRVRWALAKIYHFGGLHSGCSVSATLWLFLFTISATYLRAAGRLEAPSITLLVITYVIEILLVTIIILALPSIRFKFHNSFEVSHRFLGWSVLGLVWAHTVLLINDYKPAEQTLTTAFFSSVSPYLLLLVTLSIAHPWMYLRKIAVSISKPSNHAIIVQFRGVTPAFYGSSSSISVSPLLEWHSFANIVKSGEDGFRLVISRAGDWTSGVIDNPPTHFWIRGIPTAGVGNIESLFKNVLFVATGSGIGPVMPHLLAKNVPCSLFWSTRTPTKTYGHAFVQELLEACENAVIHDTVALGKPDMVAMTHGLVKTSGAEAVICISNPKLTKKVVYGMESRGIPAFGAIWDS